MRSWNVGESIMETMMLLEEPRPQFPAQPIGERWKLHWATQTTMEADPKDIGKHTSSLAISTSQY